MVAFIVSTVVTLALLAVVFVYAKRRPVGTPTTWGEAMVGALYVFGVMFLAYGVVPHQLLTWLQNELGWRKDAILAGPSGTGWTENIPVVIHKEHVGDILTVLLHVVFLGIQIFAWSYWQNRGKEKPETLPVSDFGRPLLRKG